MCLRLGFVRAGVAPAAPTDRGGEFLQWLADGKQGDMDWLEEHLAERMDPRRLLPGARSVIMVADQYARRGDVEGAEDSEAAVGKVARYARGRDYHWVIKKRLHRLADALRERFPGEQFRSVVDTAPLLEREHAARAGLGWIGKHTLLIDPRAGSWLLLGGIITTLELEPPAEQAAATDHCGTCTRCIDACPTGAITPHSVDARRCISYLTIEHRGAIDPGLHAGMGPWVFGCDVCQEVCPHNTVRAAAEEKVHRDYAPRRQGLDLLEVLGWNEEQRRMAFMSSSMKRARLEMIKRNAIIAVGNLLLSRGDRNGGAGLMEKIRALAVDEGEPALVRQTAAEVLRRIEARSCQ